MKSGIWFTLIHFWGVSSCASLSFSLILMAHLLPLSQSLIDFGTFPSKLSHSKHSTAKICSIEDLRQKDHANCQLLCNLDLSTYNLALPSPNTLPRNVAPADSTCKDKQQNSQIIQKSDLKKEKDVFLEHLQQRYPHHAAVIMAHRESLKVSPLHEPRARLLNVYKDVSLLI